MKNKRLEKFLVKELELHFPGKENYVVDFLNDVVIWGDDSDEGETLPINEFVNLLKNEK